ncbi:TIGR04282 family arsenosugar biosynthesis glycosyltransferase [Catellatospora citrea]|uniref:TIGR04282 family arsenosugar biosynthesis glycosyltransferase n=1 Tax=Catellatospora citrea TaxID=53366 RepID=UPI0033F5E686
MNAQFLVIAKAPVPGRVKTRLCPPCSPHQAAAIAAAALADTLAAVDATPARRRTLVVDGDHPAPPGWAAVPQRGDGLGERLAHAFADTALPGVPSVLVGMDTPQLSPALLASAVDALDAADAALGPAADGGWWVLALREPAHAVALAGVPMSTADTGALTFAALHALGLRTARLATLRDVDTAADARAVAAEHPRGRFADAVRAHLAAPHGALR